MMFNDLFWGGIWLMWIFRLVFIGLIIWLIMHTINKNQSNKNIFQTQESAIDILKKRYARGEITKEQFEQMKKDIV